MESSLPFSASLCAKQGCLWESRCSWHAWALLAASAGTARAERAWKVSVAAEGGPVCLERACLPKQRCPLCVGRALKGKAPTQVACVCYPALSNGKADVIALAVFHRCCLLAGVAHVAVPGTGRQGVFSDRRNAFCFNVTWGGKTMGEGKFRRKWSSRFLQMLGIFVVKALPLNVSGSRYFPSVTFLSVSLLPGACQSKLTGTLVSPPPLQPLHLFFFVCL